MKVIQIYQQGGRHKIGNQPCEDRTFSFCENGVNVIALADGAGSSKYTHSAEGAGCVTQAISSFFSKNFDMFYDKADIDELCMVVKTVCHRALGKKAAELELDSIARLSSTLLCVAIKDSKVIICHIGDGVIGKLMPSGAQVVSAPDNGEFASTTYFITNPNAEKYIHIIKEPLGEAIAYFLMSDGTAEYIYDKQNNSFYSAAKKMALMTFAEDGQTSLENAVKEHMVDCDLRSDDCSFIAMSADNSSVLNEFEDVILEYDPDILNVLNHQKTDDNKKDSNPEEENQANRKQLSKKIIILSSVCIVIFAALLTFVIAKFGHSNKPETSSAAESSVEHFMSELMSGRYKENVSMENKKQIEIDSSTGVDLNGL